MSSDIVFIITDLTTILCCMVSTFC